jgi:hypothetical protein
MQGTLWRVDCPGHLSVRASLCYFYSFWNFASIKCVYRSLMFNDCGSA